MTIPCHVRSTLIPFILLIVTPTRAQVGTGQFTTRTFDHDGYNRTYHLYVPTDYDGTEAWPLVISFHGGLWVAENHIKHDRLALIADTAGFLIAYPQGLTIPIQYNDGRRTSGPGWNVDGTFGEWDDVQFASKVIDHVDADYNVDLSRVHATGFSFGSVMSFAVACGLSDRIASIGGVGGPMFERLYSEVCSPARPVPVLLIQGTADSIVPYSSGGVYGARPTVTPRFWAENNGCSTDAVVTELPNVSTTDNSTVSLIEYPGCEDGTEVLFYRVNGGGHTWPGTPYIYPVSLGRINRDINATAEIWNFLHRHPHPAPAEDCFYLNTQEKVDALPDDVTEVPHYLWLANSIDIVDLSPLSAVTSVAGDFDINNNELLTSLTGLSSLVTIDGDLTVKDNSSLASLEGLAALESIAGDVIIADNRALSVLNGPPGLRSIEASLDISGNAALTTLEGLSSLEEIGGDLAIVGNPALEALDGLPTLGSVQGSISIARNDTLTSLEGLSGIEVLGGGISINDNDALTSLIGLPAVLSLSGNLDIDHNDKLVNLEGLESLETIEGDFDIERSLNLENLDGASNINHVGDLYVSRNPALENIDGLSGLTTVDQSIEISRNQALTNLDGLRSVQTVGDRLRIGVNPDLAACSCGLYTCVSTGCVGGTISMSTNASVGDCNNNGADLVAGACGAVGIENANSGLPTDFALYPAYPNPFGVKTTITFTITKADDVELTVTDLLGRRVAHLVSGIQPAGTSVVSLDASELESGIYFYQLKAGGVVETRQMVVLK